MRTHFLLFVIITCTTLCLQKTEAQNVLPLHGTVSGSFAVNGYNLWQLTTNVDGHIDLTLSSTGGTNVVVNLYAEDGTTSLGGVGAPNNGDPVTFSRDDLAKGVYVVRVEGYFGVEGSYSLSSNFTVAPVANDKEANDVVSQAKNFPQNSTTTGHILYYDFHHYDAYDWYKIIVKDDGMLKLTFTNNSNNGSSVVCDLYDIDGTTSLGSAGTTSTTFFTKDGLAAGTYYVRITTYFQNGYAAYTLTNKLFTYKYAKDAEPNDAPYQAKTIPANDSVTGHIGFYQNGNIRNYTDWWKINYTGSGSLTFNTNENNWLSDNSLRPYRFEVYNDTSAAAISSNYISGSGTINLSSLSKGYYWIKVATDYFNFPSDYIAYSISNTFTQGKAKITVVSYDAAGSCSSTNSIKYKCTQSNAPYTVQLYRFGQKYGNAKTVNKTTPFSFDNLPDGSYYATVYGDGATGNAKGVSDIVSIEPLVTGLNTSNITKNSAKLNWTNINCAAYYAIEYKKHTASVWVKKVTNGNKNFINISNLQANTKYDWSVAAVDSENNIISMGIYADSISFTTASSLIAGNNNNEEENLSVNANDKNPINSLSVSPNPASNFFVIHFNNDKAQKLNAILYDATSKAVWSSGLINTDALNNKQVNVSAFAKGIFYLKVIDENNVVEGSTKIIVSQ